MAIEPTRGRDYQRRMSRLALLLFLTLPGMALAHPHVFVDASAGLRVDAAGRLSGLRIVWLYDAFTTLNLYVQLDLDADGDGQLDAGDLAAIAEGETDWDPGYAGDTYLFRDGSAVALGRPEHGSARMIGDRVEVSFDLPLPQPVALGGHVTSLKLYDPEYFYAYSLTRVLGPPDLPGGCQLALIPFQPSALDEETRNQLAALSVEQIPDDPGIGARFADELRLTCE